MSTKLPIDSLKKFLKACRNISKMGYEFQLIPSHRLIPYERQKSFLTNAISIWYRSPSDSLWTPDSVICHVYYDSKVWYQSGHAAFKIGLSKPDWLKIRRACFDERRKSTKLRLALLDALDLEEISHCERPKYSLSRKKAQ